MTIIPRLSLLFGWLFLCSWALAAEQPPGAALYQQHCEQCHGGSVSKAPQLSLLQIMSASSIYRAMDGGVMREQASKLSTDQKAQIAEYLTGQRLADAEKVALPPACTGDAAGIRL